MPSSDFWPLNVNEGSPDCSPAAVVVQMLPPPRWLLRSRGNARSKAERGNRIGPDRWGACERNEFSEPRGLHLPILRILNSLTWYLIFDVQTACSRCCKLTCIYPGFPSWHLGAVFSKLLRCCLPGLESWTFPPNKTTLWFQVVTVFFSWHHYSALDLQNLFIL